MPIHTEIKDRIAEIVFDVPPVNAFDSTTWNSLPAIIRDAGQNPDVNVVLIRAAESARGLQAVLDRRQTMEGAELVEHEPGAQGSRARQRHQTVDRKVHPEREQRPVHRQIDIV